MSVPASPLPDAAAIGALLPHIEIEAPLDLGTDPVVFKARQRALDRDVAVCVWSAARSADPVFRTTIETGAKQLARLNHPNLISVFDSGEAGGWFYQITEYVHGKTLARSSDGQAVDPAMALRLVEGIAAGIACAHKNGVVHGELRRSSVLLTPEVTPKVGDFGTGAGNTTPADDVRALGVILSELLTGRPHDPDAPPPAAAGTITPAIAAFLQKALAPGDGGFADAAEFHAAIQDLQSGRQTRATPALAVARKQPAKPGSRGPAMAGAPARHVPAGKTSSGNLVRNLFIIAVLSVAIYFVWGALKTARTQRERDIQRQEQAQSAKRKEAAEEAERLRQEQLAAQQARAAAAAKKPTLSLDSLRAQLAAGDRAEMPLGSEQIGDSTFLLVRTPMTWPQADRFARDHGGHLAMPSATVTLEHLAALAGDDGRCWIGAGRSGREDWSLCDGTRWSPEKVPTGIGPYVSIDTHGLPRAHQPAETFAFLLQWRMDGTNPASLEQRLATTSQAISARNMLFPPGTRRFGDRLFLPIMEELSWAAAKKLAWSSGGHLAVPTEPEELAAAEELAESHQATAGLWLGGIHDDGAWSWDSGETWQPAHGAKISGEAADRTALAMVPGNGLAALDRDATASGFLIEWSSDARKAAEAEIAANDTSEVTAPLATKARELLQEADRKRNELLAANAKTYVSDLGVWHRSLNSGDQRSWKTHIEALVSTVEENRVPASVPDTSGVLLSPKMANIMSFAARKQAEADEAFAADAAKLRDAFVSRLQQAATEAAQAGRPKAAASLAGQIQQCADLETWTREMGFELSPATPEVIAPKRGNDMN